VIENAGKEVDYALDLGKKKSIYITFIIGWFTAMPLSVCFSVTT